MKLINNILGIIMFSTFMLGLMAILATPLMLLIFMVWLVVK